MGKETHAAGCGRLEGRAQRITRRETDREEAAHRKVPAGAPLPSPSYPPPPQSRCSLDQEEAPRMRTQPNVTAFAPPRSEGTRLTSQGGAYGRPPLLTRCYQACAQPISSRRRRRPAFELGTATSCCLASTQCNAVCLSALRHKGTAIL